ncbi:hypothetical protein WOLCODRAFT_145910 [Wolfiporia cocos MD-104 SS10]|uniref:C2H2-type domain-containing protein n=1 Tax=Wolfiporia cocos (strain MD-104) TaxID=742152 RepID=A0A2H3J0G6_WOLCO|nr:hypothetical protein WOLCODRAFT_145910 [Wolfiporia cocos MD-104 SS10]
MASKDSPSNPHGITICRPRLTETVTEATGPDRTRTITRRFSFEVVTTVPPNRTDATNVAADWEYDLTLTIKPNSGPTDSGQAAAAPDREGLVAHVDSTFPRERHVSDAGGQQDNPSSSTQSPAAVDDHREEEEEEEEIPNGSGADVPPTATFTVGSSGQASGSQGVAAPALDSSIDPTLQSAAGFGQLNTSVIIPLLAPHINGAAATNTTPQSQSQLRRGRSKNTLTPEQSNDDQGEASDRETTPITPARGRRRKADFSLEFEERNGIMFDRGKRVKRNGPIHCAHPECPWTFDAKGDFDRHMRRHGPTELFRCPNCEEDFVRTDAFRRHLRGKNLENCKDVALRRQGVNRVDQLDLKLFAYDAEGSRLFQVAKREAAAGGDGVGGVSAETANGDGGAS